MNTVFISAGHSNTDPGAISADGTYREADLAVRLRNRITASLRAIGVETISDGEGQVNQPLRDAVQTAKRNQGISIEIHFNAGPPSASGVEALAKPRHKVMSQALCAAIAKHLKSPLRGEGGWKPTNSGQHHRLAFCEANGVILEVCFISNPGELETYLKLEAEIAQSLADVVSDYRRNSNELA
jgi:N-acetylmuramoyl-L-alanine amidase